MLVALSGKIIVIVNPSVWGFEGIIQRFEGLAYRAVTHDDRFAGDWNGAFILQNCPQACSRVLYCRSQMATALVSSYVTPIYL